MAVEVAIRAFREAERPVDVNPEARIGSGLAHHAALCHGQVIRSPGQAGLPPFCWRAEGTQTAQIRMFSNRLDPDAPNPSCQRLAIRWQTLLQTRVDDALGRPGFFRSQAVDRTPFSPRSVPGSYKS